MSLFFIGKEILRMTNKEEMQSLQGFKMTNILVSCMQGIIHL